MKDESLCPFSKPIIGRWCRCPHARVCDRCAGKMVCIWARDRRPACESLVEELKQRSRFVLGLGGEEAILTHAQLMKIRCGGLQGMQRVLGLDAGKSPAIPGVIDATVSKYGAVADFPFNEIVRDIQAFSHRRKRSRE